MFFRSKIWNYFLHQSDVTFDMAENEMTVHEKRTEDWKVTLVDTAKKTMTGGRVKQIKRYLNDETFCLTYGEGLSDVNITKLITYDTF